MTDWDIEAIVRDETQIQVESGFQLEHVQVTCGDCTCPTATITIVTPNGEIVTDAAVGTGPVDAVYKAIARMVRVSSQLVEYSVQSVTEGIDALGTVTVRLRHQNRIFSGQSSDTDIVVASAYAYINAVNRLYRYLQSSKGNEPLSSSFTTSVKYLI